jgi:hypothetical protein
LGGPESDHREYWIFLRTDELLDPIALENFIQSFVGYGNLESDVWFIGMEEGGGVTENEVRARLEVWVNRGQAQIEDVREFHVACRQVQNNQHIAAPLEVALTNWLDLCFVDAAELQFTWERIIRFVRANQQLNLHPEEMRQYQINQLAGTAGNLAILELFPLPSPGSRKWNYGPVGTQKDSAKAFPSGVWTDLPYLQLRRSYQREVYGARRDLLQHLIDVHEPQAVVFYGESFRKKWCEIAGLEITRNDYGLHGAGATRYMVLPHPNAHGISTNAVFQQAGLTLRAAGIKL